MNNLEAFAKSLEERRAYIHKLEQITQWIQAVMIVAGALLFAAILYGLAFSQK